MSFAGPSTCARCGGPFGILGDDPPDAVWLIDQEDGTAVHVRCPGSAAPPAGEVEPDGGGAAVRQLPPKTADRVSFTLSRWGVKATTTVSALATSAARRATKTRPGGTTGRRAR